MRELVPKENAWLPSGIFSKREIDLALQDSLNQVVLGHVLGDSKVPW